MPTRLRWFQISLRGLLIAVTVLAVFLGYHLNWIRQRREFLVAEEAYGPPDLGTYGLSPHCYGGNWQGPLALKLLGEDMYCIVTLHVEGEKAGKLSPEETARVEKAGRLFPEAFIHVNHLPDAVEDRYTKSWGECAACPRVVYSPAHAPEH